MAWAGAVVTGAQVVQQKQANDANSDFQAQQNALMQKQLELLTMNSYITGMNTVRDYDKSIADLEGSKIQYGIDIRDAASQVDSYDKWLENYSGMYNQQVQSKQAQTDSLTTSFLKTGNDTKNEINSYDRWLDNYSKQYAQEVQSKQAQNDALMASGKESYDAFLNAIGYSDAMAGATGRVGAGTSQAHTTGMMDRKLVDYVGADRTLDANGGLFGSQLTAANMEMDQLKTGLDMQRQGVLGNKANLLNNFDLIKTQYETDRAAAESEMDQLKIDLDFQRFEMNENRRIADESIKDLENAISLTNDSIDKSKISRDSLYNSLGGDEGSMEEFVKQFLGAGEGSEKSAGDQVLDAVMDTFDPLGVIGINSGNSPGQNIANGVDKIFGGLTGFGGTAKAAQNPTPGNKAKAVINWLIPGSGLITGGK